MDGTIVATLDDRQNKIKVEVLINNGWFFSRFKHDESSFPGKGGWHNTPKPYKHVLGAIRGAYYSATGKI